MGGGRTIRTSIRPIFMVMLTDSRHLLTGLGAYYYITWAIWLRHCLNGRQDEYTLYWPRIYSLPEIIRVEGLKKNM